MKPPRFEYADPDTLPELLALLAEAGDDAAIIAGGQSLIPLLNLRLADGVDWRQNTRLAAMQDEVARELGEALFMLGFARLCGGQLDDAHDPIHDALEIADRRGVAWLALRCVTYLSQLARRTAGMVRHLSRARLFQ